MSRVELRARRATATRVAAGEPEDQPVAARDGAKGVPRRGRDVRFAGFPAKIWTSRDAAQTPHARGVKKILGAAGVTFRHSLPAVPRNRALVPISELSRGGGSVIAVPRAGGTIPKNLFFVRSV